MNLSLIVPIYNNADEAIKNITITLNHSSFITEVILYSNGSETYENKKLENFSLTDNRISLHIIKNPIGFVKAVNESIKLCTNDLILCINSDVQLFNDWENRLIKLCEDENNGLYGPVLSGDFILGCCFMMRKSILNKIGLLNEGFGFGYYDDNELSYRVKSNNYNLGYCSYKEPNEWNNVRIDFPITHKQGISFSKINQDFLRRQKQINEKKMEQIIKSDSCLVLKNLNSEQIKKYLNKHELIYVVNYSGPEFENIRYDNNIIEIANIFECTSDMNIDELISSITTGKKTKIIDENKDNLLSNYMSRINFRYDIINTLIEKNGYKSYLEIGVRNPNECYNLINCELKHGVDPMVEGEYPVTFKMTSDEFFEINKLTYDIIFIDGLHLDYQVELDIINSLKFLNDGGTIVLHDCNPVDLYHQREDYGGGGWNGTVWKAIVKIRSDRSDIYTSVVDMDYGCGIIQKSTESNMLENDNPYYSYNKFNSKRGYYLNLISKQKFIEDYLLFSEKKKFDNKLTWLAKFDDYTSMGILSQRILENLNNTDFVCKEIIGKSETGNELVISSLKRDANFDLGIMFAYPDMWPVLNDFKTKVIYTGVDSTGGIPNFKENANNADFLLTPSEKSKERMKRLGVIKPIFVFPHGIERNRFPFKKRKREEVFNFLYVGECSDRKGTLHLINAFLSLFKGNNSVRLIMKSNNAMIFYNGSEIKNIVDENDNIIWHISNEGHNVVEKLYEQAHAYVYPSRADTFGMTLLESMSSGLPIISTSEPGATELIKEKYYEVISDEVDVINHPWMLGKWGEPNITSLREYMYYVYQNYEKIVDGNTLEDHSKYINENYNWQKVTEKFENEILPNLVNKYKVITLATSFNRPHHIVNMMNSLKSIKEVKIENKVYIVDNTEGESKNEVVEIIKNNLDDDFKLYVSEFNMGQRGALLQMLDDINIDEYDYIQFTDQDNIFREPLSTYIGVLNDNPEVTFVTGYMSKEHNELGWKKTKYGNLCEKRTLRAGHMFMRVKDLKDLYPIHLDSQFGQPHNSSWNAGLDWELSYWNKNAISRRTDKNFVLCVPGGVIHKGIDSTFYEWPVEENEYRLEELEEMR